MKYKVGEKVVIRDWDELAEVFDMRYHDGQFQCDDYLEFSEDMDYDIEKLGTNRVLTIDRYEKIGRCKYYIMKEVCWTFHKDAILKRVESCINEE